jgi:hypothetical protein
MYDGSDPCLKSSILDDTCRNALQLWVSGEISGKLACLYVDNWTQGEVMWPDAAGGDFEHLGMVVGMLADPLLQRDFSANVYNTVFAAAPLTTATAAVQNIIGAVHPKDGKVLVSEVEHEFSKMQASALEHEFSNAGGRLRLAVTRELLQILWAGSLPSGSKKTFRDTWVLEELARTPQAFTEAAREASTETLKKENNFLDAYLMRLLRMKRALSKLLDKWEKVDYYAILGVPSTASDKDLRNAYRKACLRLHPDKGGDKAQFQQLQDAYACILEERAKQRDSSGMPSTTSKQAASKTPSASGQPSTSTAASNGCKKEGHVVGKYLALDDGGDATQGASEEVVSAVQQLLQQTDKVAHLMRTAEKTDGQLQQLKQAKEGNLDTLRSAQESVDLLLKLSDEIGVLGPVLGEAAMEVAEASLALAARFSAVPAAILLTDVALSCTFEASRMQHASQQLLEIRLDTSSTLQTLQMNLLMAKTIGSIDAETLQLSLGLVSKASRRILSALRQVVGAVEDAAHRGRQCSAHAVSISAFAAGRARADAAAEEEDEAERLALPGPAAPPTAKGPQTTESPSNGEKAAEAASAGDETGLPKSAKPPSPVPTDHPTSTKKTAAAAALESRMQNDKLLRQLNKELLDLQRRAREHLQKPSGSSILADISSEASSQTLQLVAEVLLVATEAVLADVRVGDSKSKDISTSVLEASLKRHFGFVEAASCGLAMTTDLRTQLVRLGALLNAQALINALQKGVKPRLAACYSTLLEETGTPLIAVLDQYFEVLCSAVVASRIV